MSECWMEVWERRVPVLSLALFNQLITRPNKGTAESVEDSFSVFLLRCGATSNLPVSTVPSIRPQEYLTMVP